MEEIIYVHPITYLSHFLDNHCESAINFEKDYCPISHREIKFINQAKKKEKKTMLFHNF